MKRLLQDQRATAAVEMAIVTAAILLPLTAGVIGTGTALIERYRLDRGLHAGLMYAWGSPPPTTNALRTTFETNVASAAQKGYGNISKQLVATPTIACYCIQPTGTRASGTAIACTGTCTASGTVMGQWLTLSVSTTFTETFNTPWSSGTLPLSATGTVRIQ